MFQTTNQISWCKYIEPVNVVHPIEASWEHVNLTNENGELMGLAKADAHHLLNCWVD